MNMLCEPNAEAAYIFLYKKNLFSRLAMFADYTLLLNETFPWSQERLNPWRGMIYTYHCLLEIDSF